jgi:hypothetical protein
MTARRGAPAKSFRPRRVLRDWLLDVLASPGNVFGQTLRHAGRQVPELKTPPPPDARAFIPAFVVLQLPHDEATQSSRRITYWREIQQDHPVRTAFSLALADYRGLHWNVTVLVPLVLVTMLEITC